MVLLVDKIDKALEQKIQCKLLDKFGKCFNGSVIDSWVTFSAGRLRGKLVFQSQEKGTFEIDPNDVLDIVLPK